MLIPRSMRFDDPALTTPLGLPPEEKAVAPASAKKDLPQHVVLFNGYNFALPDGSKQKFVDGKHVQVQDVQRETEELRGKLKKIATLHESVAALAKAYQKSIEYDLKKCQDIVVDILRDAPDGRVAAKERVRGLFADFDIDKLTDVKEMTGKTRHQFIWALKQLRDAQQRPATPKVTAKGSTLGVPAHGSERCQNPRCFCNSWPDKPEEVDRQLQRCREITLALLNDTPGDRQANKERLRGVFSLFGMKTLAEFRLQSGTVRRNFLAALEYRLAELHRSCEDTPEVVREQLGRCEKMILAIHAARPAVARLGITQDLNLLFRNFGVRTLLDFSGKDGKTRRDILAALESMLEEAQRASKAAIRGEDADDMDPDEAAF
jgi:hypothetical protein